MKTNLKQAFRHLRKDSTNTLINLLGLTLGFSIVAVLTVFLVNELGYNSSVTKRDRIYRVLNYDENTQKRWASSPFVLGEYAQKQIPGIAAFTHNEGHFSLGVKKGEVFITEKEAICADAAFFDMFSVKLLQGDVTADFDQVENTCFISKSLANKYFTTQDVVGKELVIRLHRKERAMQIAGVFEDIPHNSSLKAQLVFNMKFAFEKMKSTLVTTGDVDDLETLYYSWESGQLSSNYFLLKENADVNEVAQQIAAIGAAHSTETSKLSFSLQPLRDVYFNSKGIVDNTNLDKGNLEMVYILAMVGLLILLIACINYLNLSSAQAFMRARSLSINRVFGAKRSSLIGQMITESVLVAFIALPLALFIARYAMPYMGRFLGHDYPLWLTTNVGLSLLALMLVALAVGVLSGWLVALKITSFSVTEAIKGKNILAGETLWVRKATISFQFAVFIVLLVVVFGVHKQVDYVMKADMGFVKEGLIKINRGDKNYETYRQEILKNPNVHAVSAALWLPPSNNMMNMSFNFPHKKVQLRGNMVDYDFLETMGLTLLEGEDFERDTHESGVILSAAAAELVREEGEPLLGKSFGNWGRVVGVVSDFNMSSLHDKANPMLLLLKPASCGEIAVVFIASLGLFGLSVLMSKQRTKEIGIRKINGASIGEILTLLNRVFVRWVLVAFVVSTPVAYYIMSKWLENFAYKTALSWWIFVLAGGSALAIALLTVSWQSWRAATRNPVEALRYE
ncbi:MAG: hypothetical protein CSA04_01320 [Bacteroidetes bacterium]|nr:MAG: hypothetical protein CSA04_01320 [Bacteroidota bacterium]